MNIRNTKTNTKSQLLLLASMTLSVPMVYADAVEDAFRICAVMDATGLTTGCEVKGWGSTVDVTIDTNGGEARQMCAGIVKTMSEQTSSFSNSRWKLRIFSPYSGEKPIAVCTLR